MHTALSVSFTLSHTHHGLMAYLVSTPLISMCGLFSRAHKIPYICAWPG